MVAVAVGNRYGREKRGGCEVAHVVTLIVMELARG
jgi:hypothetical protein